ERAEVVRRRLGFEADPAGFISRFSADTATLPAHVVAGSNCLPGVQPPDAALPQICALCGSFGVYGIRSHLLTWPTAIALPACHSGPRGLPDATTPQPPQQSHQPAEPPPSAPVPPAAPFRARLLTVPGVGEGAPGRRSAARGPFGRTVGARLPQDRSFALHLPATVRAAALRGSHAAVGAATPLRPAPAALRAPVREGREGNLVLFAVDASGP